MNPWRVIPVVTLACLLGGCGAGGSPRGVSLAPTGLYPLPQAPVDSVARVEFVGARKARGGLLIDLRAQGLSQDEARRRLPRFGRYDSGPRGPFEVENAASGELVATSLESFGFNIVPVQIAPLLRPETSATGAYEPVWTVPIRSQTVDAGARLRIRFSAQSRDYLRSHDVAVPDGWADITVTASPDSP